MPSTPMNSGLPQQPVSYGLPVGGQVFMPDYGDTVTLGDSSVMLRSGSLVLKSAAPALAALRQYQVCGKRRTSTGAPGQLRQVASNGAGVLIAAGAQNGTVYRSTDGGDTWTAITSGLSSLNGIGGVAFGAGRFVVSGANTSNTGALMAYSTDNGLTWTAGASTGAGNFANGLYPASGRMAYTGNRFICVVPTAGANLNAFTSTDGSALLATYNGGSGLPTGIDPNQQDVTILTDGAGRLVAHCTTTNWTSYNYSADHGVTFTSVSALGTGFITSSILKGNTLAFTGSGFSSGYYVHPSANTATGRVTTTFASGSVSLRLLSADGTTSTDAFIAASAGWTAKLSADLLSWQPWLAVMPGTATLMPTGVDFLALAGGTTVYSYDAKLATSDYCGMPVAIGISSSNSFAYVRAK